MADYLLAERPNKRAYFGSTSTNMFDADDDDEQYFAFTKAAADSGFPIAGVNDASTSSILPNKDVESSSSVNSIDITSNSTDRSTLIDDAKINTTINKGTGANIDVPNVGCKAEPSSKETAESDTFKTNTSPNSKVREALAEKVNMSERSIQIWFQNRRAKMKAMQKRAHLMINQDSLGHHFMPCIPGYGHGLYPFRMPIHHAQRIALPRSYSTSDLTPTINNLALAGMRPQPNSGLGITVPQVAQGFWQSGPLTAPITSLGAALHLVVNPANGMPVKINDPTSISSTPQQPQQFTPPQEYVSPANTVSVISCETLTIGTWRRILTMQAPTDLLCYYAIPQNTFTYHITNDNTQFKMEFPLTDITSIEYRPIDDIYAQIAVEVKDPPHFYMEASHGGWNMCKDFTEDRQATRHMRHVMKGRAIIMKPQLMKLMQDDPLLAKVVNFVDDSDSFIKDDDQQNPPRRSSYPSGSIADNVRFGSENSSLSDKEDYKSSANNLRKQLVLNRRSVSLPLSPSDDHKTSFLTANATTMVQNPLHVNTALMDLYKAEVTNSSPEFCSSPMELNSSPTTPLDVFDNSPTLMDSSPLLNQDPFVSLPSHNHSSLSMDTSMNSNEIAAMVSFAPTMSGHGLPAMSNDEFANMFNMSSGSDTASDVSEFLTFNDYANDTMDGTDGFASSNGLINIDTSSWVGDVAYC
ncbi:19001_t:CDS:2 [Dentiscutata erythropus]|uniref:19001_t:CDS:1 n=1 Tax=Dentiscutata erythropus TaxID=1348616 RepID=A0A9N8ZAA8_9GLOM|nr:19001_t:CDS:2 [Dentiscutata erythropus]